MKGLILNITLLVFMVLGSMSAMAHDSTVKYGVAISHDGTNCGLAPNEYGTLNLKKRKSVQRFEILGDV